MKDKWTIPDFIEFATVAVLYGMVFGLTIVTYRTSQEVAALNARLELNFTTLRMESWVAQHRDDRR